MDKIILGMILFRKSTLYEIRNYIKEYMKTICSDSTGSIQAAIRKLLREGYIGVENITEKNKDKKLYYVTESGLNCFKQWMKEPMDINKSKNMDFGKFFFLGMTDDENRINLIKHCIEDYEEKLKFLSGFKKFTEEERVNRIQRSTMKIKNDKITNYNLVQATDKDDITRIVEDAIDYQYFCLDYDIARTKFEVSWYKKLLKIVEERYRYGGQT